MFNAMSAEKEPKQIGLKLDPDLFDKIKRASDESGIENISGFIRWLTIDWLRNKGYMELLVPLSHQEQQKSKKKSSHN